MSIRGFVKKNIVFILVFLGVLIVAMFLLKGLRKKEPFTLPITDLAVANVQIPIGTDYVTLSWTPYGPTTDDKNPGANSNFQYTVYVVGKPASGGNVGEFDVVCNKDCYDATAKKYVFTVGGFLKGSNNKKLKMDTQYTFEVFCGDRRSDTAQASRSNAITATTKKS